MEVKANDRGKPVPDVSKVLRADRCSARRQLGLPSGDLLSLSLQRWPLRP